jgi:endogenous inhibitor of DNA gyrase (YacG/DUF329 family)
VSGQPRCRECNAPGANLVERLNTFCSNRCADAFFNTWALRALAAIARMKTPSRARKLARDTMTKWRHWA